MVQFEVDRLDDERRGTLDTTAALLASELVTRGQYTDAMVLTRRTDDIPLASELLWGTLAPQTFATNQVTVAVALEPAYGVAGDGYDYAYNDGVVHAAVFDAMGHDIEASIIGNLAIGAYRHARRRRRDLAETGTIIDRIIHERFDEGKYATGLLAELDVSTGAFGWCNFGHPSPMLIRHNRVVGPLDNDRHVPLGLADLIEVAAAPPNEITLEPGDRLLLYTDGLVEARTATGTSFGVERLQDFLDRALASGLVGSEVVRRLAHAVVDHHGGSLNDDATTLMIHWHP
jgi:serine phosphatase RsbU (regulator of sigma subunit)